MTRHGNHHTEHRVTTSTPESAPTPHRAPTEAEIAARAYDIYAASGREDGHCERNWHQAECEMREKPVLAEQVAAPVALATNS